MLVLTVRIWSIFVKFPYALEKNVYTIVFKWYILNVSIRPAGWWYIFYLLVPGYCQSILKSLLLIVNFEISPCIFFYQFFYIYLEVCEFFYPPIDSILLYNAFYIVNWPYLSLILLFSLKKRVINDINRVTLAFFLIRIGMLSLFLFFAHLFVSSCLKYISYWQHT